MEIKIILIIMVGIVAGISMLIIFMGCNSSQPEFDFQGNGADSIPKMCEPYPNVITPGAFVTQYEQCINRHIFKENVCNDYFWWLRY